jgi:hypothetical protein
MQIDKLIRDATERIDIPYFQVPIAGKENPIYRERVYCYELYHQLRLLWPRDSKYALSGEVDKLGHPLIRGNGLDNRKPDILIHIPGNMDNNLLVLEVKPLNRNAEGIKKDLQTLTAFRRHGGYECAFFLVYGSDEVAFNEVRAKANSYAEEDRGATIDLRLIELWHHRSVGTPAGGQSWRNEA